MLTKNIRLKYAVILTTLIIAGCLISPLSTALATGNDSIVKTTDRPIFNLQSNGDDEVTIEFTLPSFEFKDIQGPNRIYKRIFVKGWGKTTRVGAPELPATGLILQVPASGDIDLQVIENTYESVQDIHVYPVPKLKVADNGAILTEFVKDKGLYNTPAFYPETTAKIDPRSILRGTFVTRLVLYPFQWNPVTKKLRYSRKIRLKVRFGASTSKQNVQSLAMVKSTAPEKSSYGGIYARLKQKAIINYRASEQKPAGKTRQSLSLRTVMSEPNPQQGLKIEIKKDGIYRVTYSDMVTAGLNPATINPATFQLFNMGNEVAANVSSAGGTFASGDYIEFYGDAVDNQYTGTNVYWLYWGGSNGERVATIDGDVTGVASETTFLEKLHIEENHTLWESMPGAPDDDYWFWEKITSPASIEYTINLPSFSQNQGPADILVQVAFHGRSTASPHPNHHMKISLNNGLIGDYFWDGDVEDIQDLKISPGLLSNGSNTLKIESEGSSDTTYFNWMEINYQRDYEAVDDQLRFSAGGDKKFGFEVKNFTQDTVEIYDITDPYNEKKVENASILQDQSAYKVNFEDQISGEKTYFVSTVKQPESITLWTSAGLKNNDNSVDYIVIAPNQFSAAVAPLAMLHQNQGLSVKSVAIEDIYNEFSYGMFDPKAIRDFLTYAYNNWQKAPTYVLLAGDANMDYRDYWGTGKINRVPTHLSWTDLLGITPNDNWYVCVDGDDILPDMQIGRIPGADPEMVAGIVNKIISYQGAPPGVLLVADNNETDFEDLNNALVTYLPAQFTADKVYLASYGSDVDAATADIIEHINDGELITNYVGHGAVTNWAGEYMFESSDIVSLNNANKLTFVLTLNCLNGYFAHMNYYSLAEEFVAGEDKGAVAVFAPSGLGYVWEHEVIDNAIFSTIFNDQQYMLGTIISQAMLEAYNSQISAGTMKMFHLFGDPVTTLNICNPGDIDGNYSAGLEDVIITLKILSGISVAEHVNNCADINGDGRIGLAEAIYVLQHLSELRN